MNYTFLLKHNNILRYYNLINLVLWLSFIVEFNKNVESINHNLSYVSPIEYYII